MSKRSRRLAAGLFPLQIEILENRLLLSAAATSTTLIASDNPIALGQVIALTANVSSPTGSPDGGNVLFMDGSTVIGTVAVDTSSEQAVGFTDSLDLGTHNITAIYSGTSDFAGSTSSALTETVNSSPAVNPDTNIGTTTTLTFNQNPINASTQGQTIAMIATVSPASGTTQPTGTVSFFDGSSLIGTVSVDPTSGMAVGFTASLSVGTHSITATYNGTTGFATSTSSPLNEDVVNSTATTTTLTTPTNPITQGQLVAIAATVSGGVTGGTINFIDGGTLIGSAVVDSTGEAVGFWNTLATGAHSIVADYIPAPEFSFSDSSALALVINANVSTTTTVAASSNPIVVGQLIALTATVTGAGGIPTGNVTFKDGSSVIGTVALDATGHAVGFTAFTNAATHNITAVYSGDTGYLASTSAVAAETVNLVGADTTTSLTVTPSPDLAGQTVALIATVTSISGSPTGTVTFTEGSTVIGTAAINSTTHQAIGFTASLPLGANSLAATYNGSASFAGSVSNTVSETVNPVGTLTATALATSANATVFGQLVILTATVTSGGGSATGTISFMDGTVLIGTASLSNVSGAQQAFGLTVGLTPGMHSITAVYNGANGFATSTSSVVHVTVNSDATATTLTSSANNVQAGGLVVFTATVTAEAPGSGNPTGTVTFMDGSTLIGTASFAHSVGNSAAVALAGTVSLTPGAHSITAIYNAGTGYSASTSTVFTETIVGIATTTAVTASNTSPFVGQTVTFTATVTGAGATPGGTVTFTSGSTTFGTGTLNANGVATVSEYNLNTGTYPVTATYNGDATHSTSVSPSTGNGSATFTVNTPTFTTVPLNGSSYQTFTATTGTGAAAQNGQLVSVDYTLYLSDGSLSQTSVGSAPFQFGLGENSVVAGFDAGVVGIKTGETRVLILQPAVAYGANPPAGIPANEVLTFIVRLDGVDLPRLTVTSGSTQVPLAAAPTAALGTDFGTSAVGLSTASSTFTLGNADSNFNLTSSGSPIIKIIGADPSDFVITQPSAFVNGVFTIAFLPTAKGVRTATIQIGTNDTDVANFTFNIQGIGV